MGYSKIIEKIKQLSDKYMDEHSFSGHDAEHVERVRQLALRIAEKEGADMIVVEAAALMHDLGRWIEKKDSTKDHAEESVNIAKEILKGLDMPDDKVEAILYAIKVHRFSKGIMPDTKEAKVLQDADRLDSIGAIGIARCFLTGGAHNRLPYDPKDPACRNKKHHSSSSVKGKYYDDSKYCVDHFFTKLLRISEGLHTKTARGLADARTEFMKKFLEQIEKEINGEF
jgi:uncharacterized protein